MKNKYTIGLDGNLISESFISNILNEQGKTAAELAAEARAKRASTGSAQPATTTKSTSTTGEKSEEEKFVSILNRGDARALEYVIYATTMAPLMYLWWTNWNKPKIKDWSNLPETKKYFPNLKYSGLNPLSKFQSYMYWYDPTIKEIFGPSKTFRENIQNQEGWYYLNVWEGMMKALNQITYYKNNKDHPGITKIFENVYSAGHRLISDLYNSPSNYKIEIPCAHKLMRDPDEFDVYIKQALATTAEDGEYKLKYPKHNNKTVLEQLQPHMNSLVGVLPLGKLLGYGWKEDMVSPRYTAKILYSGKRIESFPLRPNN
jgi:hypothetical protein